MEQQITKKSSRPHGRNAHTQAHAQVLGRYLQVKKTPKKMYQKMNKPYKVLNVLVACEESQAETEAFRELGHNAFSCDIQPCRKGKHPEWHIHADVSPYLHGDTSFVTDDGTEHHLTHWDLIIAHPPCTYLCKLSSVQLMKDPDGWRITSHGWKFINIARWEKLLAAKSFFLSCLNAEAPYVAVENPIPMAIADLPKSTAFACPSWYGVKYTKKTLYWLKNLPPLIAGAEFVNPKSYVGCSRGKYRSRTFPQLARALAKQWSQYILDDYRTIDNMPEEERRKSPIVQMLMTIPNE